MRNKYKQRKSNDKDYNINNNKEEIIKYNFNSRFIVAKENIPIIKQKEIYKNKIISKIRRCNPNIKIIHQSNSFSRFDNEGNFFTKNLSRNNRNIKQNIKTLSINYIKKKKERNSFQKNYSASSLKDFYSPLNNSKKENTYTLNSESTSVTKKKKFQIKPYKSTKKFSENEKDILNQNKENISNNIRLNKIPVSPEGNNNVNNKGKIRTSFKYLIHQAYKNKALSKSFSRFYKSSRSKEKEKENEFEEKKDTRNKMTKMNLIKKRNNLIIRNRFDLSKINKNNSKFLTENNNSFFAQSFNSFNSNKTEKENFIEDFEIIFSLLKKIRIILNKIDNYGQISEDCYNYIQYFFNNLIHNKLTNFFSDLGISYYAYYIKKEIIFFFLCYDISFNISYYKQTGILLKAILKIIYSNYVVILHSFLLKNKNDSNELKKFLIFLEKEMEIERKNFENFSLKNFLENNIQYINNYYKMIVDNIYKNKDTKIIIKFPYCINSKELYGNNMIKINIICSFFNEAFKTSSNETIYSFNDLQKFFYLFLQRNYYNNNINNFEKRKEVINNSIKNVSLSNFNLNEKKNNNQRIKYLLPKIKNNYEYSLVLDLDGTLISYQKNKSSVILRPGLTSFLHNMKKIFELILFTSAMNDYVDPIVNFIEKDEKYFDFILYRKHLSYDEKGESFKNLNLLNRNGKKIIIVDDTEKNFKLHKSNGICIKTFYGENDNVLSVLSRILIKLKLDAEKTGDIRIGLKQIKKDLIYKSIENKYK